MSTCSHTVHAICCLHQPKNFAVEEQTVSQIMKQGTFLTEKKWGENVYNTVKICQAENCQILTEFKL